MPKQHIWWGRHILILFTCYPHLLHLTSMGWGHVLSLVEFWVQSRCPLLSYEFKLQYSQLYCIHLSLKMQCYLLKTTELYNHPKEWLICNLSAPSDVSQKYCSNQHQSTKDNWRLANSALKMHTSFHPVHLFTQQISVGWLLCARFCFRLQRDSSVQDTVHAFQVMAFPAWILLFELIHEKSRCLFLYLWFNEKHTCPKIAAHPVLSYSCGTHLCFQDECTHLWVYKALLTWNVSLITTGVGRGTLSEPHIFHLHILCSRQWLAFSYLVNHLCPESLFPCHLLLYLLALSH